MRAARVLHPRGTPSSPLLSLCSILPCADMLLHANDRLLPTLAPQPCQQPRTLPAAPPRCKAPQIASKGSVSGCRVCAALGSAAGHEVPSRAANPEETDSQGALQAAIAPQMGSKSAERLPEEPPPLLGGGGVGGMGAGRFSLRRWARGQLSWLMYQAIGAVLAVPVALKLLVRLLTR